MADGVALAASKSCSVDVNAETIKVSSATDADWEHSIAGRKSWSLTTNHLLQGVGYFDGMIEAFAYANDGSNALQPSYVIINGVKYAVASRGLNIIPMQATKPYAAIPLDDSHFRTFDTYGDNETARNAAINSMITWLTQPTYELFAIVSFDAYGMTVQLASAISTALKVDMTGIPNEVARNAFVAIGGLNITKGTVAFYPVNGIFGYHAKTKLYMLNGSNQSETVVADSLVKVGSTYKLRLQMEGFSQDYMEGNAICQKAAIVATKGNLMTGSYSWRGTGPLRRFTLNS
jgi:hypothetical protein